MNTVTILCEGGGICNSGVSAESRERALTRALPGATEEMRHESLRHARSRVSRELAYTPHVRCGVGLHGQALYACTVCGHERVYGGSLWSPGPYGATYGGAVVDPVYQ